MSRYEQRVAHESWSQTESVTSCAFVIQGLRAQRSRTTLSQVWWMAKYYQTRLSLSVPTSASDHSPEGNYSVQRISLNITGWIPLPSTSEDRVNRGSGKCGKQELWCFAYQMNGNEGVEVLLVPRDGGIFFHFLLSIISRRILFPEKKWGTCREHMKSVQAFSMNWQYFQVNELRHWF